MDVLINIILVIISQHIHVSNHHIVYLKLTHDMTYANILIQLEDKKIQSSWANDRKERIALKNATWTHWICWCPQREQD